MRARILTLVLSLAVAVPAFGQVPFRVPLQGTLYEIDGTPVDRVIPIDFRFYADSSGTDEIWADTMGVTCVGGVFTAYLGTGEPIDPLIFAQHPQVFVGIAVDGDPEMDLFPFATAPYAAMAAYAGDADTLDGYLATDIIDEAIGEADARYSSSGHGHGWPELTGVPPGFADDIDDVLTEDDVVSMVTSNGFLTSVLWSDIGAIPAGFADGVDNDSNAWSDLTGVPAGFADGTDDGSSAWSDLTGIPAGFADGTDDVASAWSDLTGIPAGFADGTDDVASAWGDLTGIPAGFADGVDDDTQLTNDEVVDIVSDAGFLSFVVWPQILAIPAGFADGIDNDSRAWGDLTGVPAGFADGIDDASSAWDDLTGVPAGFADGVDNDSTAWSDLTEVPAGFADGTDDDTQLSENDVRQIITDAGFLDELRWDEIMFMPAGFWDGVDDDTDTQLSDEQVTTIITDAGFLTAVSWDIITGIPAGFADGTDDDTDTFLTEDEVDAMVSDNGFASSGSVVTFGTCSRVPATGEILGRNLTSTVLHCPVGSVLIGFTTHFDSGTGDHLWVLECCTLQVE